MVLRRKTPLKANRIRTLRPGEEIPSGTPKRYKDGRGYIRLRWLVGPQQYVEDYEHRIVMGRPPGDVHVHHINGDKADNRPENLRILSAVEHAAHHAEEAKSQRKYGPYRSRAAMEKAVRAEERRRLLRERSRLIVRLYEGGMTTVEIGQTIGLHPSNVGIVLREAGILTRSTRNSRDVLRRNQHLVKARAKLHCEVCGRSVKWSDKQVHHRRPRGSGGSSDPAIHSPANLLLACPDCHSRIESRREEARDLGYLVPHGVLSPADVPVQHAIHGLIHLDDDGGWRPA